MCSGPATRRRGCTRKSFRLPAAGFQQEAGSRKLGALFFFCFACAGRFSADEPAATMARSFARRSTVRLRLIWYLDFSPLRSDIKPPLKIRCPLLAARCCGFLRTARREQPSTVSQRVQWPVSRMRRMRATAVAVTGASWRPPSRAARPTCTSRTHLDRPISASIPSSTPPPAMIVRRSPARR